MREAYLTAKGAGGDRPKDSGEEKVETGGKVTIKAELLDEVLKDYRGPQGTDAWDKEKADPNGKPQKASSLPQTFTRSPAL